MSVVRFGWRAEVFDHSLRVCASCHWWRPDASIDAREYVAVCRVPTQAAFTITVKAWDGSFCPNHITRRAFRRKETA